MWIVQKVDFKFILSQHRLLRSLSKLPAAHHLETESGVIGLLGLLAQLSAVFAERTLVLEHVLQRHTDAHALVLQQKQKPKQKSAPSCPGSSPCCSGEYPAVGYDGAQFCQNSPPVQCPGTWTEWTSDPTAVCNDTCGNCGVMPAYRYCWPSGCQCPGAFTQNTPCGNAVCLFPRASCCAPYVKKIVGGKFVCG